MSPLFSYHLYLVIAADQCNGRNFLTVARQAIAGGVDIIQLREKSLSTEAFLDNALRLKEVTDKAGIPLIINDHLEVAMQVGAFGIHVGNNDLPPSEIRRQWPECQSLGYSIEYLRQLQNAETTAADYLGISPVFNTTTKQDTVTEWGLEGIAQIRALTDKPLVAIGNINRTNAGAVIRAGADCIAVVAAICNAPDPQQAASELKNIILKHS